jgi:hypothetical protein
MSQINIKETLKMFRSCGFSKEQLDDMTEKLTRIDEMQQKAKKRKLEAAANGTLPPSKTPNKDAFFNTLKEVQTRFNCESSIIVRSMKKDRKIRENAVDDDDEDDDDEDDDDEDDDEEDGVDYPIEKLNTMRHILINTNREKMLRKYTKYVDPDEGFYNTSVGSKIILNMAKHVKAIDKINEVNLKFDSLFALTYLLSDSFENWIYDNEIVSPDKTNTELDKALALLGKIWKRLLEHSNEDLRIDSEYTRPGIEAVLEKFSNLIEECDLINSTFEYA